MFSITTPSDAHKLARLVSSGGFLLVMFAKALVFPREDWFKEATVTWAAAWLVCYPIMWYVGGKIVKIHELNIELHRLVCRDRLTNVATRDHFFEQLAEMPVARGTVLMVDIDHFKKINDTYGHLVGDQVIARVATLLQENTRSSDLVCRFGGEEFVIFLNRTDRQQAWQVAERLRLEIASEIILVSDKALRVTASFGGALKHSSDKIDDAIKAADTALYQAKNAGRNKTVIHEEIQTVEPKLCAAG